MKKKILFILLAIVCLGTSSCQKDDVYYSCDPQINKWVKSNLSEIGTLTRNEVKNLDGATQRAIYRAFTPVQRKALWVDKINEVLSFDLNAEERAHIEESLQFIEANNFIFESNELEATQEQVDKLAMFLYKWTEYALEELGWDIETCYAIVVDFGQTKVNVINNIAQMSILQDSNIPTISTRSERDCNCNISSMWYVDCENDPCNYKSTGCGGFTFFSCDGLHRL